MIFGVEILGILFENWRNHNDLHLSEFSSEVHLFVGQTQINYK